MILQCPECNARYAVPDNAVGAAGRTVRCAKCHHSWHQAGVPQEPPPPQQLDQMLDGINSQPSETSEATEEDAPRRRRRRNLPVVKQTSYRPGIRTAAAIAWSVTAAMLVLYVYPTAYGIPKSHGLALADAGMVKIAEDKKLAYELSGKIVNTTDRVVKVPKLRITLVDDKGNALRYWDFSSRGVTLEPTKSLPFTTGTLDVTFSKANRFVMEIGSPLELALRRKPE